MSWKELRHNLAKASEEPRDFVTPDWIAAQVKLLRKAQAEDEDHEAAHSSADTLHRIVLKAISQGIKWPCLCSYEALQTEKIKFERWCA